MPASAVETCAKSKHSLGTIRGPANGSLFHTSLNQVFVGGFDGAAADRENGFTLGSVFHMPSVLAQMGDRLFEF